MCAAEPTNQAQVVAVTGASAGIGRATARAFAARGARVALVARGELGLQGVAKEVEDAGGRALIAPTDVADYAQVAAAVQRIEAEFGQLRSPFARPQPTAVGSQHHGLFLAATVGAGLVAARLLRR
jgi:NAD(P)-dependent dehydrogenase (short-subunit alcohol dehydrogenase family)